MAPLIGMARAPTTSAAGLDHRIREIEAIRHSSIQPLTERYTLGQILVASPDRMRMPLEQLAHESGLRSADVLFENKPLRHHGNTGHAALMRLLRSPLRGSSGRPSWSLRWNNNVGGHQLRTGASSENIRWSHPELLFSLQQSALTHG